MSQYQVDSERIAASSAAVCSSITAIRDAVTTMYANLNALQDAWRGAAAAQFNMVASECVAPSSKWSYRSRPCSRP